MAVGSILAEAALQFVGAVLEFPVRGLGYGLLRYCARFRDTRWDSHAVLIVGMLGWLLLFILAYTIWQLLAA
jgi:uncharacterized membrane protein